MNERQVNAFRLVMKLGSITSAARALNVSQPAVSRLIGDLERDLGFPLFERRSGKIFPTPDARGLAQEVDRMFYGLERLERFAREMRGLHHGTLSLASLPMVSFEVVPRSLGRFLPMHKGVRVTHNVHTSPRILDLVGAQQIDLGIAQMEGPRSDVRRIASYRTHCVCVMAPNHPLAGRESLEPHDLEGEPIVALAFQTATASAVTQRFAEAGVALDLAVESQPSYSACALAAEGIGIGIVDPLTPSVFASDRLRTVPFEPAIPFDLHVLTHADRTLSRAASAFIVVLLEAIEEMPQVRRLDGP